MYKKNPATNGTRAFQSIRVLQGHKPLHAKKDFMHQATFPE